MIPELVLAMTLAMSSSAGEPLSYLALGDSYTIGEGVADEARWPVVLARRLSEAGMAVAPPVIVARTGWTTDELDAAIDRAELAERYDLVSLLIGVNNQYRGREVEAYRREFADLLERAIGFAGGAPSRVFVLSIPDWGVTPFAEGRDRARIARELDAYNQAARAIAAARGVAFVDITPISREAGADLAADGLHPGAAQYARWAEAAQPVAAALLRR